LLVDLITVEDFGLTVVVTDTNLPEV